jgi:chromosome condensin MukBEF ATPase and DNA-binding subunit MukB
MSDDLIKRLRSDHGAGESHWKDCEDAADLIEQQSARIAELEATMRKQANAARCLADATIRDASIRQELAEKARAESSPEVLTSERQANAMLTEENERLTARLAELEAQIATVAPAVDAQPGWISVDERMPDEGQSVAFVVSSASPTFAYLNGRVLGGYFGHVARHPTFSVPGLGLRASHWMPLPTPPHQDPQ